MKKQTIFSILYVVLIVSIIAFMIFMVFWLKSESAMCMRDPMVYYAEKTGKMCFCNDLFNFG